MTCREYKALSEQEQINALTSRGVYLADRKDSKCRYLLYQLDGFYIEIVFGLTGECKQKVNIFQDTGFLDPYLEGINIMACL